jgi:transcriptional regulator with XRE-family HTH domain
MRSLVVMNADIIATNGYLGNFSIPEFGRKWLAINGNLAGMSRQDTKKILSDNLRRLMDKSAALDTQVKVAQRAGIAQSTVGRLLRGEVYAQLSQVEALAEAFKVDVAALLSSSEAARAATPGQADAYAQLTEDEKKQVGDFIAFLAARHSTGESTELPAIDETTESPAGLKERLMKAIQRELNNDTQNIANERKEETKRGNRGKRTNSR